MSSRERGMKAKILNDEDNKYRIRIETTDGLEVLQVNVDPDNEIVRITRDGIDVADESISVVPITFIFDTDDNNYEGDITITDEETDQVLLHLDGEEIGHGGQMLALPFKVGCPIQIVGLMMRVDNVVDIPTGLTYEYTPYDPDSGDPDFFTISGNMSSCGVKLKIASTFVSSEEEEESNGG